MEKRIFLPGLNGLRAIAAVAVIVSHIGLGLKSFGLESMGAYDLASFGVTIFFTLSGFLITFLLLLEKEKIQTIKIKDFYIRRALRIWPLYYFYIALALIVLLASQSFSGEIIYYLVMLPNVPFSMSAAGLGTVTVPFLVHYWSLGVEEQFYLFWPLLIRGINRLHVFLILFIVGFFLIKFLLTLTNDFVLIKVFLHYTRFGCMSIGALGALAFYKKVAIINIFNHKIFEIGAWIVVATIAINKFHIFSIIDHEIVSALTLILIFNQINNKNRLISLENKWLDYLGKISFGLYIYNPLIIYLLSFIGTVVILPLFIKYVLVYTVCITMTILISHVSYFYFEKKFLKYKKKFTIVNSASSSQELEIQRGTKETFPNITK